jgi:hypothetical protein
MTDPRHEEEWLQIEAAVARFFPVFLEMAVALVHADAPILSQMMAVETALLRTAARFAGIINKQYHLDIKLFADLARVEFDRVAAEAQTQAKARAARVDDADTGVRH